MNDYHTANVQINAIWQAGDIFPAVILTDDGKEITYILLGSYDVKGAWIAKPITRHAPKCNDLGPNKRQDQAFRTAFYNSLQHAVNLLNGTPTQ